MNLSTVTHYEHIVKACKRLFDKKNKDYGSAWRIFRKTTFIDQIMIKAERVRSIQELKIQKVGDSIPQELMGIINYAIMAVIQTKLEKDPRIEIPHKELTQYYQQVADETKELLLKKNHDYKEVWRQMQISSMVDIILMKLLRIKRILAQNQRTLVSEGIDANYMDILNYAVFCLIQLDDTGKKEIP